MSAKGLPVPTRTRDEIGLIADAIRKRTDVGGEARCNIVQLVEVIAKSGFEVVERDEIGDNYGLTYPDSGKLLVRADVYNDACNDKGWAREVMAHELGHLILHRDVPMPFLSSEKYLTLSPLNDSEWQANTFADLMLAPLDQVKMYREVPNPVDEISRVFGVSNETAFRRWIEARCR